MTSFLVGENNFVMHFFLKEMLKASIKGEIIDSQTSNVVLFTLSAESKGQADNWAKEIESAGGTIVSRPEEYGKGYYGFRFAHPDDHKFNVFYMESLYRLDNL